MTIQNSNPDYYFGDVTEEATNLQLHKLQQGLFSRFVERVLTEYGVAENIRAAGKNRGRILDIGCGEGLYLHDVAAVLEKQGLLTQSELYGVDINPKFIETAEAYSHVSNPPRPYLQFFTHDVTVPFEKNPFLPFPDKAGFEFIYMLTTLEHLPNAKEHIGRFYQALKPGGILYIVAASSKTGLPDGMVSPHPALDLFIHLRQKAIADLNSGVDVASEVAGWLSTLGATILRRQPIIIEMNGKSEIGLVNLRVVAQFFLKNAARFIAAGLITQQYYEETLEVLYKDYGPHAQGQTALVRTIAQKPR